MFSPSSAHRWSRCPASVFANASVDDDPTEHSKDGTLAHKIAAWALSNNKPVAKYIPSDLDEVARFSQSWHEPIQRYVDYCRSLKVDFHRVEQQLSLDPYLPGQFGTSDFWGFDSQDERLYVVDLKFGQGELVYANYSENGTLRPNEQLVLYGLGAYLDAAMIFEDIAEVELTIHQPRRDHVSTIRLSSEDLRAEAAVLGGVMLETTKNPNDARYVPGERQCRWCPSRATCSTRADWHLETFKAALDEGVNTTGYTFAKWLAQFGDMEQWMKDVRESATTRLRNGLDVGGWKLVAGRGRRVWNDKAAPVLTKELGPKAWQDPVLIGITEAEKLLGKKNPVMDEITTKTEGSPTLAPPTDPRPALRLSAADDFPDGADLLA